MKSAVRGATVVFTARFYDINRDPVTPDSASVIVNYPLDGSRADETVTLVLGGDSTWTGEWNSLVSDPGRIEWSLLALGTLDIADEGNFQLLANQANLEFEDS